MKRHLIGVLTITMILGVALVAVAQQGDAARQRWLQRREAQNKAIQAIQADAVKLRAAFEEAGKAMPSREKWESLSEEERGKLREAAKTRWEQQLQTIADIELQVAVFKGPRQLKLEQENEMGELLAVRELAKQEKAAKTAERVQWLIDRRQAHYDQIVQKVGIEP